MRQNTENNNLPPRAPKTSQRHDERPKWKFPETTSGKMLLLLHPIHADILQKHRKATRSRHSKNAENYTGKNHRREQGQRGMGCRNRAMRWENRGEGNGTGIAPPRGPARETERSPPRSDPAQRAQPAERTVGPRKRERERERQSRRDVVACSGGRRLRMDKKPRGDFAASLASSTATRRSIRDVLVPCWSPLSSVLLSSSVRLIPLRMSFSRASRYNSCPRLPSAVHLVSIYFKADKQIRGERKTKRTIYVWIL